ncbi:ATP-binding protein [Kiritimatiellota bacterium B12222]|nr:ATP-binding protein [Kiritimatiellota bacterium B12222]
MSLLMLSMGVGYFFTSFYVHHKFTQVNDSSIPAITSLNKIRLGLWNLWEIRDNEDALMNAFQALEKETLTYVEASTTEHAQFSIAMRKELLELQEIFDAENESIYIKSAERINDILSEALSSETEVLDGLGADANKVTGISSIMGFVVIVIALIVGLVPGWWLARVISKALANTQEVADSVASGDLTRRLPEDGHDEISELAIAFNRMVDNIREADEEITREVDDRIRAERKAQIAAKAKSDFLAHMSHEFRTPLNGILGYSQMLSMDSGLSQKNLDVVKSLRKSGESLLELINDVLDLTKIEAQKMSVQKTRFYLGDFMDSLLESFAEQVTQKGLKFEVDMDKNLPEDILSDQIRLRQIIINLLGNALKFTDKGSVGLSVKPLENGIRFSITDTGVGIAEEDLTSIMQPFHQVETNGQKNHGTGLGLPISNRLLEMMNSSLHIDSELGKGTTFWFDLPQPDIKHRKLVYSPTHIKGYRGKARKVLIGESGLETATMLMPLLQKVGFEILHLRNSKSLLEKCDIFQPDVVLIDLYFSDLDGIEVMSKLQTRYEENKMPVVLLFSNHRSPNDRERSLRAGANAFVGVPIRFADLLEILREELSLVWIEGDSPVQKDNAPIQKVTMSEIPPPIELLEELLELSRSGNVRQLKVRLQEIQDDDHQTTSFCSRMLSLCAHYRVNAILKELETLVEESPKDTEETNETPKG